MERWRVNINTDSPPAVSDLPLAHHPDSHIVEGFDDFPTETAPEMLLGKIDDLSATHHNGTEIPVQSSFNNFVNGIALND